MSIPAGVAINKESRRESGDNNSSKMEYVFKNINGFSILFVIIMVMYSPIYQYAPDLITNLVNGTLQVSDRDQIESTVYSPLRYLRDIIVIFGIIIGLLSKNINNKYYIYFILWEMLIILLGSIGHLILPRWDLYISGLRWVLNIQLFATILMTLINAQEKFYRAFVNIFSISLIVLGGFCFIGFIIQWWLLGFREIYRLTSFFSNPGTPIQLTFGLLIYFSTVSISRKILVINFLFSVCAIFFTQTRGISVVIAILYGRFIFLPLIRYAHHRGLVTVSRVGYLMVFGLLFSLLISIPFANFTAHRGDLVTDAENSRINGILEYPEFLNKEAPFVVIFGKGLGYQTTTANLLSLRDKYNDPWISAGVDLGVAAIFAQIGIVGVIFFIYFVYFLFFSIVRLNSGNISDLSMVISLITATGFLLISSWAYEWQLFMTPLAVSFASVLRAKQKTSN